MCRNIAYNKNEIFMVEICSNYVHVFSCRGKLIRSWRKLGDGSGHFKNLWGIAIYKDIVDTRNHGIQTCNGRHFFFLSINFRM